MDYTLISQYYERNREKILNRVKRKVPQDEAEDIVNEVFLRMMAYYHNFDKDKGKFSAWVNGITRNCIKDYQKVQQQQGMFTSLESVTNREAIEPSYHDNSAETKQEVDKLLSRIKKKRYPARDIVYMRYFQDYTAEEIAVRLGLEPNNVYQHLYTFKKEVTP